MPNQSLDEVNYFQDEFSQAEDQSIDEIRKDEVRKSILKRDEERLQSYVNQQKMSALEDEVNALDKQLLALSNLENDDIPEPMLSSSLEKYDSEDSSNGFTTPKTLAQILQTEKPVIQVKKGKHGCQLIDVSEEKMRNFVMD